MYTTELYTRCFLTVLVACLVVMSVMWGKQTVSETFLRCSNLHIQLASEGFVDVRAEADQADSGAAVRTFSASRTLVGVAECKQVGYAAAWIINIDLDYDDDKESKFVLLRSPKSWRSLPVPYLRGMPP
eukprot:132850_1